MFSTFNQDKPSLGGVANYYTRNQTEYYSTMYLDGYSAQEVYNAMRTTQQRELLEGNEPDPSIEFLQGLMASMKRNMTGGKRNEPKEKEKRLFRN